MTKDKSIELSSDVLEEFMVHHKLWKSGRRQEALRYLDGLMKKYPDNSNLHQTMAEFMFELGHRNAAWENMDKAISYASEDVAPYIKKGELLIKDGLISEGLEEIERALKTKKLKVYLSILFAADFCLEYGFFDEARKIYEHGFQSFPTHGEYWHRYCKMYLDALRLEEYYEKLQEGIEKRPDDLHLWFEMTKMAGLLERDETASKGVKTLAKIVKQDAQGLQNLAVGYAVAKDYVNAEWAIRESLKLNDRDGKSQLYYGCIMRLKGQEIEGQRAFTRATEISRELGPVAKILQELPPMILDKWYLIQLDNGNKKVKEALESGSHELFMQKMAEAYQLTKSDFLIFAASRDFPSEDNPMANYSLLSMVFSALKETKRAIGMMYRAMQQDPENPEPWENLAKLLAESNGFTGAARALEKVLALNPDRKEVKPLLGYNLSQINEFEKAASVLEDVLQDNPDDETGLQVLPGCYLNLDRHADAIQVLERATKKLPDLAHLQGWLALAAHAVGDKKKSKKALKKCMKLDKRLGSQFERDLKKQG